MCEEKLHTISGNDILVLISDLMTFTLQGDILVLEQPSIGSKFLNKYHLSDKNMLP